MLRTNLSSRPFYNERLASFVIAVIGVIAIAVVVVSVQQILSLSSERTRLRDRIARDEAAAGLADTESMALQKLINNAALKGLAISTQQANTLIDERTFSWTVFFGLVEKTLPNDVRIVSVAPVIDKSGVLVLMTVISKRPDDLATFVDGLQSTGAFYDVQPRQEDATDDGMRRTSIEARYLPPKTPAPVPDTQPALSSPGKDSPAPAGTPSPAPKGKGGDER
jgi:hypothetical protein